MEPVKFRKLICDKLLQAGIACHFDTKYCKAYRTKHPLNCNQCESELGCRALAASTIVRVKYEALLNSPLADIMGGVLAKQMKEDTEKEINNLIAEAIKERNKNDKSS